MALDGTYAGLQASIADFLNRTNLTTQIPDFIALAEARMSRELDVRQMMALNDAFSIATETVAVPTGFAGVKSFRLATSPVTPLTYVTPDRMDDIRDDAAFSPGKPLHYTVVGDTFVFSPAPDATYTARLRYRQTIPALSVSNTSNWLLTRHPDVYLYGSLLQSAPYLKADARIPTWEGFFSSAIREMKTNDMVEIGGSAPRARTRTFG